MIISLLLVLTLSVASSLTKPSAMWWTPCSISTPSISTPNGWIFEEPRALARFRSLAEHSPVLDGRAAGSQRLLPSGSRLDTQAGLSLQEPRKPACSGLQGER